MKKLLITLLIAFLLNSCTNPDSAQIALKQAGYHPIKVGGYGLFECSEDDVFATRFTAYSNDSSMIVKGCVCEGLFKGKTIRLD